MTFAATISSHGQDALTHGLYRSKDDFVSGKANQVCTTDSANYLLGSIDGNLYIVRGGGARRVPIDSIFGYYSGIHRYRAFTTSGRRSMNGYYRVEDIGYAIVYSKPGIYKTSDKVFYYFSRGIDSSIMPLTLRRLRREYPQKELLYELRRNRRSLTSNNGKTMTLNALLNAHLN